MIATFVVVSRSESGADNNHFGRWTVAVALAAVTLGCSRPGPLPRAADADPIKQTDAGGAQEKPAPSNPDNVVDTPTVGPIRAARETTLLLGPLAEDGRVDYMAAFNQRWSEGVTAENNFAVALLQAMGPTAYPEETRNQYASLLGIALPPAKGDYFVSLDTFVKQQKPELSDDDAYAYSDRVAAARVKPWDADDFPLLAAWFEVNQKPLDQIVQGVQRTQVYFPLVGRNLATGRASSITSMKRQVARALPARAMFKLKTDGAEAAWSDLMACFRLARHDRQGPTMVNLLIGIAMQGIACESARAFACQSDLTADQHRAIQRAINELETGIPFGSQLEFERCIALETVAELSRPNDEPKKLEFLSLEKLIDPAHPIDWNVTLREINRDFDRLVPILAAPRVSDRVAALDRLLTEIRNRYPGKPFNAYDLFGEFESVTATILAGETPQERGRRVAIAFSDLFLSTIEPVVWAGARAMDDLQQTRLTFALAGYRRNKGAYPTELALLVPQYARTLGKSRLTDAAFHYQPVGAGFTMSSIWSGSPTALLPKVPSQSNVVAFDHRLHEQATTKLRQSGWEIRRFDAKSNDAVPSDDDLLLVSSLPGIAYLTILNGSNVTDDGFAHIAGLPNLEYLNFWNADTITDKGFAHLSRAGMLGHLTLSDCTVTAVGLRHLAHLKRLTSLYLIETRLTDRDLAHLPSLVGLELLNLRQSDVTDAGLRHIAELKNLTDLGLAETGITDEGLKTISQIKGLTSLDLSNTMISDRSLRQLESLKNLKSLDLSDLIISAASLKRLKQALPECAIAH